MKASDRTSRRSLWPCLRPLVPIGAAVLVLAILDRVVPSKAVRALPKGATEIQDYYRDGGITGDFIRLMKALIPQEQVADYARRMGALHEGDESVGRDFPSWNGGPAWWSPRKPPWYYSHERGSHVLVGWEDGYVHFDACAW